ncbi:DNA binding protein [Tsukamurella phage TIN4]|uniref:DNA binding protein n=2 Tax=Tinduovirus TIN3 TaxID=1982571 RepID=A0A0K0N5S9_9CAUD|nr:DNA binding protein [Tsukamurella phage TIN3]YP_009604180.1 DNA binding protein [Tsukamurella phage TIN4]AKJ71847.1 DNA binding protein [Tsukamurella phage TIN3]AKJ71956.1 DNA binding protein [Tsukamurella phage TIN4]
MNVAPEQKMLNTKQVSDILLVEPGTVRELVRAGKFPNATRPGKGWLIPQSDVTNYIKETNK